MSAVNLPGRLEEDVVKKTLKFGKLKRNSSEEANPLARLSDLLLSLHAFFPIHSLSSPEVEVLSQKINPN